MTDVCGFANTGSMYQGMSMTPKVYGSSTNWTVAYVPSPSNLFGNVILYPNLTRHLSMTSPFNMVIKANKSITFFTYFWLNVTPIAFALIEFDQSNAYGQYSSYFNNFWHNFGGLTFNFGKFLINCLISTGNFRK